MAMAEKCHNSEANNPEMGVEVACMETESNPRLVVDTPQNRYDGEILP